MTHSRLTVTKHRIYARHKGVPLEARLNIPLIKRCIIDTLNSERVDLPCELSVLIIDDINIRKINRDYRGTDKATDVLSFPMQEFSPPGWTATGVDATDQETGYVMLGDIILSAERVIEQAYEYAQTKDRETAYLIVHSVLHLLGYDHADEADDKKKMRSREKEIMRELSERIKTLL